MAPHQGVGTAFSQQDSERLGQAFFVHTLFLQI